jgi:succinate-semialdehyde dehydrogenase / glutarate-semialdehyde dehydrogenase
MTSIVSINPWTGQELARFANDARAKVDAALSAAVTAQAHWRNVPIAERVLLLGRLARVLREGKERYARLITLEMGKPIGEAKAEIEKCAWNCDFYADMAPVYLADEAVRSRAGKASVVFDPLGVVLAIMPWNYPLWQFFRFAAPAFAAGNGAILKHANNVPQCALAIQEIVEAAGAPAGLLQTLLIEPGEVAALIADDRIAAVTLTGSTRVGSLVAAQAGAALKKQVLELGGSDPFIVLADADIEAAASVAVRSRFLNAGQSCVNAKRFIVEERAADEFIAAFSAGVERLRVGDPLQRDTDIGPMARANLRADLHEQVQRTVAEGGALRSGGSFVPGPGFAYAPTVIDRVAPQMAAFREETFGPVAAISRAKDVDEAIALANRTEFGLGASLWSRDVDRARRLARRIDAGAVFINSMAASSPELPFGGIKKSGYGRELGSYGIREFVNIKTVCIGSRSIHVRANS